MDEILLKQLLSLGFSEKEASAYLVCLEFGPVLASSVSKQTGIKRSSIYDVLDALLSKGYLSIVIKSGVKYFLVEDPSQIEQELKRRLESAQELLPKLAALKATHTGKRPVSKALYSEEGIKDVFTQILRSKELWSYGRLQPFLKLLGRDRIEELLGRVSKGGLNWFDLREFSADSERQFVLERCESLQIKQYFCRSLSETFSFPNACLIYNHHSVAFLSYDKDLSMVIVEDEQIFQTQKEVFRAMWAGCSP